MEVALIQSAPLVTIAMVLLEFTMIPHLLLKVAAPLPLSVPYEVGSRTYTQVELGANAAVDCAPAVIEFALRKPANKVGRVCATRAVTQYCVTIPGAVGAEGPTLASRVTFCCALLVKPFRAA